jgi:hypothetical protein
MKRSVSLSLSKGVWLEGPSSQRGQRASQSASHKPCEARLVTCVHHALVILMPHAN